MTDTLLLIQALLLVGVLCLLWRRKPVPLQVNQDELNKAVEKALGGHIAATEQDRGVWQVLRRDSNGEWNLHCFVREDTPAWRHAYDTPGLALRHEPHGQIEEGIQ